MNQREKECTSDVDSSTELEAEPPRPNKKRKAVVLDSAELHTKIAQIEESIRKLEQRQLVNEGRKHSLAAQGFRLKSELFKFKSQLEDTAP